jgi:hypothetical protein
MPIVASNERCCRPFQAVFSSKCQSIWLPAVSYLNIGPFGALCKNLQLSPLLKWTIDFV